MQHGHWLASMTISRRYASRVCNRTFSEYTKVYIKHGAGWQVQADVGSGWQNDADSFHQRDSAQNLQGPKGLHVHGLALPGRSGSSQSFLTTASHIWDNGIRMLREPSLLLDTYRSLVLSVLIAILCRAIKSLIHTLLHPVKTTLVSAAELQRQRQADYNATDTKFWVITRASNRNGSDNDKIIDVAWRWLDVLKMVDAVVRHSKSSTAQHFPMVSSNCVER